MAFRINDAEREALRGMHHMDQVLYVFGIRPHMDYATRIAGESRRLSIQSFREALEVSPGQGPAKERGAPSKWRILRGLDRLEGRGLIERDRDLVMHLPLADAEVRLKTFRTDSAPITAPDTAHGKTNKNNDDTEHSAPDSAPGVSDIPHHLRGQGNSVPKGTGTDVPESSAARTWRLWLELVGDTRANRAVLGKIIKDHGEEVVAEGVATTWAKAPADPVSYLRGCLKPRERGFVC